MKRVYDNVLDAVQVHVRIRLHDVLRDDFFGVVPPGAIIGHPHVTGVTINLKHMVPCWTLRFALSAR